MASHQGLPFSTPSLSPRGRMCVSVFRSSDVTDLALIITCINRGVGTVKGGGHAMARGAVSGLPHTH